MKEIVMCIAVLCTLTVFGHKTDSIGTKVKNDKVYILHKIEKGDGLYSLSKKYGVSLKSIVDENPGSDKVVKLDQILWIPTNQVPVVKDKLVNDYFSNDPSLRTQNKRNDKNSKTEKVGTFAKYHTVEVGQTLYAISKLYNTSVEMIMTLNNLESTSLSEGQKLLVQDGKAEYKEVDRVAADETDYEKIKEGIEKKKYADVGFDTEVETKTTESSSGYSIKVEKLVEYNIEKVEETGFAIVGDKDIPEDKNYASHFNAPIGTVIMVTNPETKSTVFVKVVRNFTKSENSAEIIRLSPVSAKQIGISKKHNILLSYAR